MAKRNLFIMVIVILLVMTPLVSAFFQFDNIKGDLIKNKDTSEYGKIEIRNSVFGWEWFQLDKIMSLELKDNTELCLAEGCSAKQEIIMYEDGILIDDIRFIDLKTGKETDIKSYEVYVNGDIYNGEKVSGYSDGVSYNVELKGKVYAFQEVDWQVKAANTDWIDDWAVWGSSLKNGTIAYWGFDEGSGTNVEDSTGNYDLTTNATWDTGIIGNALGLDYTDTYAYNDTFLDTASSDLSFSFWMRLNYDHNSTIAVTHNIFNRIDDIGSNSRIDVKLGTDGKLLIISTGGVETYADNTFWHKNQWYHIAIVWSDTNDNITVWVDGILNESDAQVNILDATSLDWDFAIGYLQMSGYKFNGSIDEFSVHNRTLSPTEISDIYNSGVGLGYDVGTDTPIVNLISPVDSYNSTNKNITFNCNVTVGDALNISNISLYHNETGTWTLNQTNSTESNLNSTSTFNIYFQDYESIEWNCLGCANNSLCSYGTNRTLSLGEFFINSQAYNTTVWETDTENFLINVSGNGSVLTANLWYDGTSYVGTRTGDDYEAEFTRTIDIPTGTGNQSSFYWEVSFDGNPYINSSAVNQSINITLLNLCNATLTVPYINYTFKDEENLTALNGSMDITTWNYYLGSGTYNKSATFLNVSVNPSYGFCLNPDVGHKSLHHDVVVQYYGSGYPQRRWTYDTDLTNSTKNQTLYLLGSADGIYSIYQTQTSAGSSITGVIVQVERQFAGTWTLIEQGTTDGAGAVTFWLNPDYDHRLTFTKLGYTSLQETLRPSSSTYTVVMGTSEEDNATYNSLIEGISWTIRPNPGMLNPSTNYTFEFNVTSLINSLTDCKMELLDENNTVLSTTTGCIAIGGNLSVSFNTSTYPNLKGKYSLDIGDGYFIVDADAFWGIIDMDFPERGTIKAFFTHLKDLNEFGTDDGRAEFSRIIFFFLILVVVLGIMCRTTGWDFSTQGGAILLLFPIILMASVAGFFTISYMPWAGDAILETWMQKYTVALISFFITGGFLCHKIADSMK